MQPFRPDVLAKGNSLKKELPKKPDKLGQILKELPKDPDELEERFKELEKELAGKLRGTLNEKLAAIRKRIKDKLKDALEKYKADLLIPEDNPSQDAMNKKLAWWALCDKIDEVKRMIENL